MKICVCMYDDCLSELPLGNGGKEIGGSIKGPQHALGRKYGFRQIKYFNCYATVWGVEWEVKVIIGVWWILCFSWVCGIMFSWICGKVTLLYNGV